MVQRRGGVEFKGCVGEFVGSWIEVASGGREGWGRYRRH